MATSILDTYAFQRNGEDFEVRILVTKLNRVHEMIAVVYKNGQSLTGTPAFSMKFASASELLTASRDATKVELVVASAMRWVEQYPLPMSGFELSRS